MVFDRKKEREKVVFQSSEVIGIAKTTFMCNFHHNFVVSYLHCVQIILLSNCCQSRHSCLCKEITEMSQLLQGYYKAIDHFYKIAKVCL